jgi:hypothetical protein
MLKNLSRVSGFESTYSIASCLALSLVAVGCGGEQPAPDPVGVQGPAPLFELRYSDTGSIAIYDGGDDNLMIKASGKIGLDDPAVLQDLMALDSFPAIYSKLHPGEAAPQELVDLDARYQLKLNQFVASEGFRARKPALPEDEFQEKDQATFKAWVCNKTFYNGSGYRFVPYKCSWVENDAFLTSYYVAAYDWVWGWNETTAQAKLYLFYGYTIYPGNCYLAAGTYGYCSWTGTFEKRFVEENTIAPDGTCTKGRLGLDIHQRYVPPPS